MPNAYIIYEDANIIVVNKDSGVEVDIPDDINKIDKTHILHVLPEAYPHIKKENIFLVHRLDKYTSGIVVVAKNKESQTFLENAFKTRSVDKIYHAILIGYVKNNEGIIEVAIGKDKREPNRRTVLSIKQGGQKATTTYKALKRKNNHTLVEFSPKTGRTHQLRVHSSYIGHPIVGDRIYSKKAKEYGMKGFALLAKRITFTHPVTKKKMTFSVDYGGEFLEMMKNLKML